MFDSKMMDSYLIAMKYRDSKNRIDLEPKFY